MVHDALEADVHGLDASFLQGDQMDITILEAAEDVRHVGRVAAQAVEGFDADGVEGAGGGVAEEVCESGPLVQAGAGGSGVGVLDDDGAALLADVFAAEVELILDRAGILERGREAGVEGMMGTVLGRVSRSKGFMKLSCLDDGHVASIGNVRPLTETFLRPPAWSP